MSNDTVIKVEGVYKKFCRSLKRSMAYGTIDLARNLIGKESYNGNLRKGEFWSLENINFEVKKGESFGLVGANGSGKTTLLRLINGIFPPDRGQISIKGRIGALIAVGAGFHPHMTGRENIFLNATILGMTKAEIKSKFDSIVAFADIGQFLDSPVSTYSSGMYVRLGFAIAIHSDSDIVLVDEILAVGDAKFQRKCLDKIQEMRKKGTSFLLVSHNMQNIMNACNRAILIHHGQQIICGSTAEVVPQYELLLQKKGQQEKIAELDQDNTENLKLVHKYLDFGTDEISVKRVSILDKNGNKSKKFKSEEPLTYELEIEAIEDLENIILVLTQVYIGNFESEDQNYTPLGTERRIKKIKKGRSIVRISFDQVMLTTGVYKTAIHFFDSTFTNPYSQGIYGFFDVSKSAATMSNAGRGSPLCWTEAVVEIN